MLGVETVEYFDRHALRYDELIESVAFQLDDAYDYLAQFVSGSQPDKRPLRILELGIGTGGFTRHLLKLNPAAVITGVDASEKMLENASENLSEYRDRLSLIHGEFPGAIPEGEYDCVVSAIALSFYTIDHAALFRKVHQVLQQGGLFAYAVNVALNASPVERVLFQMLRRQMSLTDEQLVWLKGIKQKVNLYQLPTDWHRSSLSQGGFVDVDCIYLRHKLGIFCGAKPWVAI